MRAVVNSGLIAVSLALLWTVSVRASVVSCCSPQQYFKLSSSSLSFEPSSVSYPSGSPYLTRLQEAAAGWNDLTESSISITIGATESNAALGNNQNDIWFTNDGAQDSGGNAYLAATAVRINSTYTCGANHDQACCLSNPCAVPSILEVDIVFYGHRGSSMGTTIDWNSNAVSPLLSDDTTGLPPIYYSVVANHEMGHAIGFLHTPSGFSRMAVSFPNGGWFHGGSASSRLMPFAADRMDANLLYPASNSYSDSYMVAVQSYANNSKPVSWDGSSKASFPRSATALSGLPRNYAKVGHNITYVRCAGNNGDTATTGTIKAYLSTDLTLGGDIEVSSTSTTFPARTNSCSTFSFTVPTGTVAGTYYILWGTDSSTNNVAAVDRPLYIIP